jgi:hypothetical protein
MERTDNYGLAAPEDPNAGNRDINDLKKKIRAEYANDNEGYKQALAREGIDSEVPETNSVQSIQQAYYSGKIDKNTRDYMMADAIAKFARNTGRDIGNIGAQFTGGAINNNYETSEWDKRNSALAGNETTARLAEQEGSEANLKRKNDLELLKQQKLNTEKGDKALEAARVMEGYKNDAKKKAEELRKEKKYAEADIFDGIAAEYALLTSASTSDVGTEEHVGNALASIAKAVDAGLLTGKEGSKMSNSILSWAFSSGLGGDGGLLKLLGFGGKSDVAGDIKNELAEIQKMAPSDRDERIMKLYKGKGDDRYKLAALVDNNQIDPNRVYGKGVTGKDVIAKVEGWAQDPKFLENFEYYTDHDLSDNEAIQNIKNERAAQEEAKAQEAAAKEEAKKQALRENILKEAGLKPNATDDEIRAKIKEFEGRPGGSKGNRSIKNKVDKLQSLL